MAIEEQIPLRLAGKRLRRVDSPERLTGHARYAGDLSLPVWCMAELSAVPTPRRASSPSTSSLGWQIVLAFARVNYVGQPVAVVLAECEAAAEDGSHLVDVEYEALTPAIDPLVAMRPDAPVVRLGGDASHEGLGMHGASADRGTRQNPQAPNLANHTRFQHGDVAKALAEADVVVSREYRTPWVHQSYIEPQVCVYPMPVGGWQRHMPEANISALRHPPGARQRPSKA